MATEFNLSTYLSTSIFEPIDAAVAAKIISETPFVAIPGVPNVRGLGGLPVTSHQQGSDSQVAKKLEVKSGRLFRSAQLNDINKAGREKLVSLNIGAIFDLRTTGEVRKYARVPEDDSNPSAGFLEFTEENIELHHIPMKDTKRIDQRDQMAVLVLYGSGDDGFLKGYDEMLDVAGGSYATIMRYILEQIRRGDDGKACIWHCHVGKDRTGVFSALLLNLLGVPDEAIAQDYALTRAGLEPIRLQLLEQWKEFAEKYPQVTVSLAASNASLMMKFLEHVRTKYGGGRGWFLKKAGLTEEELDEIRAGLIVESS